MKIESLFEEDNQVVDREVEVAMSELERIRLEKQAFKQWRYEMVKQAAERVNVKQQR